MDEGLLIQILVLGFLVECIVLHEIAHGAVAFWFGDPTAEQAGRLTLNPIPHIDPFMTIILPAATYLLSGGSFIFGGAKPVPVNPHLLKPKILGDICVSLAGVAVNFLLAVICILVMNFIPRDVVAWKVFQQVALLNLLLMLFNLIPIPPLDGSHVFKYLLPQELRHGFEMLGRSFAGFIIIIVLINIDAFWEFFSMILVTIFQFLAEILIFM